MPEQPACGGPRQSFYVAGYERAEAKQAGRVAELEAALVRLIDGGFLVGPGIPVAEHALKGEQANCPCGDPVGGPPCSPQRPCSYAEGMPSSRWKGNSADG